MADTLDIVFQVSGLPGAVRSLSSLAGSMGGGGVGGGVGEVAALTAGIVALGVAAAASARYVSQIAQAQTELNSTMRDTLTLSAIGGAAGTDFASAAAALRQQSNFSPLGRMAGAQLGIPFAPFDISEAHDTGKDLLNAIKAARQLFREDPKALMRDLRNLPALQPFSGIIKSPQNLLPFMEEMGRAQEKVFNPTAVTVATEFSVQWAALLQNMKALGAALTAFILPGINTLLTGLNLVISTLLQSLAQIAGWFGLGGGGSSRQNTAAAHTAAVRENTEALRGFSGMFGGGARAHAAIPGAFAGNLSRDGGWAELRGGAARLGAYSIGM